MQLIATDTEANILFGTADGKNSFEVGRPGTDWNWDSIPDGTTLILGDGQCFGINTGQSRSQMYSRVELDRIEREAARRGIEIRYINTGHVPRLNKEAVEKYDAPWVDAKGKPDKSHDEKLLYYWAMGRGWKSVRDSSNSLRNRLDTPPEVHAQRNAVRDEIDYDFQALGKGAGMKKHGPFMEDYRLLHEDKTLGPLFKKAGFDGFGPQGGKPGAGIDKMGAIWLCVNRIDGSRRLQPNGKPHAKGFVFKSLLQYHNMGGGSRRNGGSGSAIRATGLNTQAKWIPRKKLQALQKRAFSFFVGLHEDGRQDSREASSSPERT